MKSASAVAGLVLSAALSGLAVAGAAEQGTVYQWVDKDGTPHYQDRPPEGADVGKDARELSLRYNLTNPEAVATATRKESELNAAAGLREQQQAEDRSAEQADRDQVRNEREQGCQQARDRLTKYETAHRLYKPGPDGQRTYLSDEEIDAARAEARRAVDEWCGE